jgi:hypothetical protein
MIIMSRTVLEQKVQVLEEKIWAYTTPGGVEKYEGHNVVYVGLLPKWRFILKTTRDLAAGAFRPLAFVSTLIDVRKGTFDLKAGEAPDWAPYFLKMYGKTIEENRGSVLVYDFVAHKWVNTIH